MDKRQVEQALLRKGFASDERDHTYFIYYTADGLRTPVKTKTSHGSQKYKTLGPHLVSLMARQCGLTKSQFEDLIRCPLSRGQYEAILQKQNRI